MNSRELIMNAVGHKETKKIPIDFGGTTVTGISASAYKNLLDHLDLDEEIKIFDVMQQIAHVSDDIKERFNSDVDSLYRPRPRFNIPIYKGWKKVKLDEETEYLIPSGFNPIKEGKYIVIKDNETVIAKKAGKTDWFNVVYYPMEDKDNIEDLKNIKLPKYSEEDLDYLKEKAEDLRKKSNRAIVGTIGKEISASLFESGQFLRGYENFMIDIAGNRKYTEYLLDLFVDNFKINFNLFNEAVNTNIDILKISDDYGGQSNLLISPDVFKNVFKPRMKKIIKHVKDNSDYKIFFHCDGAIYDIIPDLTEIGVDILNPVQLTAEGMDINKLKNNFGRDLTFWGGGIDNQKLRGMNISDIEEQIKRRLEIFSKGGGYVFSTVHNIQAETNPQKIIKIFETVNNFY